MSNDTIFEIDKALNAARARKAVKAAATGETSTAPVKEPKTPKEKADPKRSKVTDEEKVARQAEKDASRLDRKAARDLAREAKHAERVAAKRPAHMSKVDKAASKLPVLSEAAQAAFDDITSNFGAATVAALAVHFQHFNRVKATERAQSAKALSVGDSVTIVSGDPRYIGRTGEVFKAQRIRCYVTLEGVNKPIYLFTSDVELMEATLVATGTDG